MQAPDVLTPIKIYLRCSYPIPQQETPLKFVRVPAPSSQHPQWHIALASSLMFNIHQICCSCEIDTGGINHFVNIDVFVRRIVPCTGTID